MSRSFSGRRPWRRDQRARGSCGSRAAHSIKTPWQQRQQHEAAGPPVPAAPANRVRHAGAGAGRDAASHQHPSGLGGDVAAASRAHRLKFGPDCDSYGTCMAPKRPTSSPCCAPSSPHSISVHPVHQEHIRHRHSRTLLYRIPPRQA